MEHKKLAKHGDAIAISNLNLKLSPTDPLTVLGDAIAFKNNW